MKEEDNILKKVGKENVFRVPDGYFENLTSRGVVISFPKRKHLQLLRENLRSGRELSHGYI